ncbi:putative integral membrane protein [Babesia bovis T2Bo]|uniref:Uncharacterized protein n=1 Tax=Babesia bovis TaxID=5865 RepID=A7AMA6_BABBO|nr:putative integral membrane protein [Babesia bovis T2Bo]EDO07690.1 putative integral membrane protein [Babesia bovis T2Bo]|eukprot:XP_001611258.1 hypothetical protein [Babesia bovis T2Bo]
MEMTTETPVPLSTLGKATTVSACEQDGFYLCPSTAIFFGLIILCLGSCAALLINDVVWTSTQVKYKSYFQNGDLDPSFNVISLGILLCYILIHVFGYKCGLISASLSQCQKGFIACAGIVVFCSFLNVFVVGWTEGVDIPFRGFTVFCFTSIQALAMIGFIIASFKLHCFGGCYTRSKVVFYIVGILNILYGALYILECLVFYDSKKNFIFPNKNNILRWTHYKNVAPVAYVLQVALCLCAYQVSICHIRFTPVDVAFLCIGGLMVGTLVAVTFSAYGKEVHEYVVYPLMALHVIISVGLLILTHQNRPLVQFEGGELLGGSSWDVLYVVITVESLVCIAGSVSTIFAKYENKPPTPPPSPPSSSIERVGASKQLLGLHIYVTFQLLVLTKLKKPFNKYYTADYLSAIILALILVILLVGTAVGCGWAKLGSLVLKNPGSPEVPYLTYKDPNLEDYVPLAVYLLVVIAAFLTFGYKCNILEVWGDWISDKAGTYYKENPKLKRTTDKP